MGEGREVRRASICAALAAFSAFFRSFACRAASIRACFSCILRSWSSRICRKGSGSSGGFSETGGLAAGSGEDAGQGLGKASEEITGEASGAVSGKDSCTGAGDGSRDSGDSESSGEVSGTGVGVSFILATHFQQKLAPSASG